MKSDLYLKVVLTVIAVALIALALQATQPAFSRSHHLTKLQDTTIGRLQLILREICSNGNPCYVKVKNLP